MNNLSIASYQYYDVPRTKNTCLSEDMHLLNACMGLAGEAGEVIDHVKKAMFQGHEISQGVIANELGDIMYYVCYLANCMHLDVEELIKGNVDKLKRRYPNGFSAERSVNRLV